MAKLAIHLSYCWVGLKNERVAVWLARQPMPAWPWVDWVCGKKRCDFAKLEIFPGCSAGPCRPARGRVHEPGIHGSRRSRPSPTAVPGDPQSAHRDQAALCESTWLHWQLALCSLVLPGTARFIQPRWPAERSAARGTAKFRQHPPSPPFLLLPSSFFLLFSSL